ncbi:MAG: tetratricopeptide repeat protein [Gemmatimonadota bacterium]|jgi:tetratricopeptide (TPR) repeat protein|nr:tetratricopeptide repeat protein [Gemmatimonadota bacterium]
MRVFVPRAVLFAALAATVGGCSGAGPGFGVDSSGPEVGGRALVLIPEFPGPQGANVANELRGLVTEMSTHAAISKASLTASMKEYGLTELDEISARQLASIIGGVQMVAWGEVTQAGSGLQTTVKFIDSRSGDEINVPVATGATPAEVASAVFTGFERSVEGVRQAAVCTDNLRSGQNEQALQACNAALAVVPNSSTALLGKGTALLNLKRYEEAIAAFNQLLQVDPSSQDALLRAGLASSWLERGTDAVGFYRRYLEINPNGNRLALAGEISQTGDYLSAFRILEGGLADNATNTEYQGIVFQMGSLAGRDLRQANDVRQSDEVFQKALAAYQVAYGNATDVETPVTLRMIELLTATGRTDDAVRASEAALARKGEDAQILAAFAGVYREAGRDNDEIAVLTRLSAADPNHASALLLRAQAYNRIGDYQAAAADLASHARIDATTAATVAYGLGAGYIQPQQWEPAAAFLNVAYDNMPASDARSTVALLLGTALVQQTSAIAQGGTGNVQALRNGLALADRAIVVLPTSTAPQAEQLLNAANQLRTYLVSAIGNR